MQLDELKEGELHIFTADLDSIGTLERLSHLYDYLDEDERARYERYKVDFKKREFLVGRALVKKLLAGYLTITPGSIYFDLDSYGKPALPSHLQLFSGRNLYFNLTHAKRYLAFAFSTGANVGVDVEYIDRKMDIEGLADRYFTSTETEHILSAEDSFREFFRIWTLKEAYIKAVGHGLSIPLNSFEVPYSSPSEGMEGWFFYNDRFNADYFVSAALSKESKAGYNVKYYNLDSLEIL